MLKDLRHAVRMLLRAKAWTIVVLLSLALGIGANTALFSATNGLLLQKLPVRDPDTLVRLKYAGKNDMVTSSSDYGFSGTDAQGRSMRSSFSYPMFKQFVADNQTMSDVLACVPAGRVNFVVDGQADIASAFLSTGNYYRLLGVSAMRGRTISPEDDRPGAPPVGLISSKYWRSRFVSDPQAVGKIVRINHVPVTIVGILPPSFSGIQRTVEDPPDVSLPLSLDAALATGQPDRRSPTDPRPPDPRMSQATYWFLQVAGRLKAGVTAAQVQANLEGAFQATARAGFAAYLADATEQDRSSSWNRNRTEVPRLVVQSAARGIYDVGNDEIRSVTILSVIVALVLLIVCANVANLLLSRATTRQKEISVRLSLGATRARLIRQLLTESLLLAGLGGAFGVLVGHWGKQLLPGAPGQTTVMDWRVLWFVLVVTGITGLVFGIAPALRGTGFNVSSALKETGRSVAATRTILSKGLLVVQVAISVVLLIGAGLFLRTLQNLRHVDVGFNPHNLVLFRVSPQLNRYDEAQTARLHGQLIERLRSVAGIKGVALSQPALLSGSVNGTGIFVAGRTYAQIRGNDNTSINRLQVSDGFFETMGIPIVLGRGFTARDTATSQKVAVINEAAVRKYFSSENPLGQHFGGSPETSGDLEIVGVLRDAKYNSVRDAVPPTMYVPYVQTRAFGMVYEVRTAADPVAAMGAIREAVRQVDPNLPLMDMSTQIEQVEKRFLQEKLFAQAYALFGGLAVLVAAVGLFGLMSYSVARRTNEIGIRMALGAQRQDVLRLVMRESMVLVVFGVAMGCGIALAAGRFVATLLFGVPPTDVLSMLLAMALMVCVSAVAGYLPARRAAGVDPLVALHYE